MKCSVTEPLCLSPLKRGEWFIVAHKLPVFPGGNGEQNSPTFQGGARGGCRKTFV